jgi:hypothetical protein
MIYIQSSLTHHLRYVAIREMVSAIPSHAQKDDCGLGVPPLKGRFVLLHEDNSRMMMDELAGRL